MNSLRGNCPVRYSRGSFFAILILLVRLQAISSALADPPAPAVFLAIGHRPPKPAQTGLLSFELYRQAILIAARDGMGLQTRDESLREWRPSAPPAQPLVLTLANRVLTLRLGEGPDAKEVWREQLRGANWPNNCAGICQTAEGVSRTQLPAALRANGWAGDGNMYKADAGAPAQAEVLLAQLDELSQFAALRLTHELIRTDGESAPRLGVLVRAYANLSQLTRFQWSAESDAYAARSMLYAQRMVIHDPKSPFALWHRAYARSLAGLQGPALTDLAAAQKLRGPIPPLWLALLDPFCSFDLAGLKNVTSSDPSLQGLGTLLSFLAVENTGCQGAEMRAAQDALTANPQCLRIIDAMCGQTGPGMESQLLEQGPQIFSLLLGEKLLNMPAIPKSIVDLTQQLSRPGGNPAGREQVCQALIDGGSPAKDTGEPSWTALGRAIQEITFSHAERNAEFIAVHIGGDASGYVREIEPLIADHPYRTVIEAFGLLNLHDWKAAHDAIKIESMDQITFSAWPARNLMLTNSEDESKGDAIFDAIFRNLDCTSFAATQMLSIYDRKPPKDAAFAFNWFRFMCPKSPMLTLEAIQTQWDAAKAATWQADQGDYPAVAFALADKYAELKQYEDAIRCSKKYLAASPDKIGYVQLAGCYLAANQEDLWLSTLQEFLQQPDYGLQHAGVQVDIARHYMDKGEYDKALPYADAAAQTGAAWALFCDAGAKAGVGDWDGAEKLISEEIGGYGDDPRQWYAWCIHTGHGNRAAASAAWHQYLEARKDRWTPNNFAEMATLQLLDHKPAEAIATWRERYKLNPGPVSDLHIALIADTLKDSAARDAALSEIISMKSTPSIDVYLKFAGVLQDGFRAGADTKPDVKAIDELSKNVDPFAQATLWYLAAGFAENSGLQDEATRYLKQITIFSPLDGRGPPDVLLAYDALRTRGIDTMALEQAAAGPTTRVSLEP